MEEYYLFLDECGTSSLKSIDESFPVLALTGVLIAAPEYDKLCEKINFLKAKYFHDKPVVIHCRDMRKYQNGFEIFFDRDVKKHFYYELDKILTETDYQLISSAIDKTAYLEKYGLIADDPYQVALTSVMERAVVETDSPSTSAIIRTAIESRGKKEDKVVSARYHQLLYSGSMKVSSERFKVRFTPNIQMRKKSDMEVGIEIADFCAYPIARFVLNNDMVNPAFEVIRGKIRSDNNGGVIGYGVQVFP